MAKWLAMVGWLTTGLIFFSGEAPPTRDSCFGDASATCQCFPFEDEWRVTVGKEYLPVMGNIAIASKIVVDCG